MLWKSLVLKTVFGLLAIGLTQVSGQVSAQDVGGAPKQIFKSLQGKKSKQLFNLIELFPESSESAEKVNHFVVEQTVQLTEVPIYANLVQLWISLPGDEKNQKLVDLKVVACPGKWKFVTDQERRGSFLFVELEKSKAELITVKTSFQVLREPEYTEIDPAKTGELSGALKMLLAEFLVQDAPHMTVTPEFQAIADKVCGEERNTAVQAKLLLEHVAATVDHYSYTQDPSMPTCGIGDASVCKKQGGGCCTDLNSYFITLARARGIPARLNMGYRLQEKNQGKLVDPGYRCWVEYFVPNYGWISADVVEADTPSGLGHTRWLSGLTSRRIWLNQGREFAFADKSTPGRINNMTIGYAEVDGVAVRLLPEGELKPQLARTVLVNEVVDPVVTEPVVGKR